ncbi:hypothetical protein TWF694_011221 [Orbilia ellipsospora]|uniref:Uncharacterized protein n=1 Tax=Orbilia ellipsospora TaxID=2528407 RepID=A0AAV9XBH5_9PEZI
MINLVRIVYAGSLFLLCLKLLLVAAEPIRRGRPVTNKEVQTYIFSNGIRFDLIQNSITVFIREIEEFPIGLDDDADAEALEKNFVAISSRVKLRNLLSQLSTSEYTYLGDTIPVLQDLLKDTADSVPSAEIDPVQMVASHLINLISALDKIPPVTVDVQPDFFLFREGWQVDEFRENIWEELLDFIKFPRISQNHQIKFGYFRGYICIVKAKGCLQVS